MPISQALRDRIIQRANGLCEYCQTAQIVVIEMEIDHIIPESAGGTSDEENLCLSCISCNRYKGSSQTGINSETGEQVALFNPRTQVWHEHFMWSQNNTIIMGLTPIGYVTITRLKMNREITIKARERWVAAGWHPPKIQGELGGSP